MIAAVAGLVILVVGLIAIVRGGFDGPMSTPVVEVLGFTHTTLLGLIEIAIGGALLISGATRSRSGAVLFGSVLGIAGFVGAVQTESFTDVAGTRIVDGVAGCVAVGDRRAVSADDAALRQAVDHHRAAVGRDRSWF